MDENTMKNACPVGKFLSESELIEKVTALETKLSKVLTATASDSGKSLLIDANGNVKLST